MGRRLKYFSLGRNSSLSLIQGIGKLLSFAFFLSCATYFVGAQDQLILVSPHWEGIQYEFTQAFSKWYAEQSGRSVELHWREIGGASGIEKSVQALYKNSPETCGMDVMFGGGTDPYVTLKAKGYLAPYRLPQRLLAQIPMEVQGVPLMDPEYTYYGAALSSFGIVQNRPICKRLHLPEVQSWEDLTNPDLYGWVSSVDPRKSGSVHMIYEIILQAYGWERGWEIIYQMSGNVRTFLSVSASATKEVGAGDAAYAIAIDINGLSQQAYLGVANIRFFIPANVSVINPDAIAIFKGAPDEEVARRFLEFVLSENGQRLWMQPVGSPGGPTKFGIQRMGVLPGLYSTASKEIPLNPFAGQVGFTYKNSVGSKRWALVNDLIGQTVINVHSHLKRAWRAINKLPRDQQSKFLTEFSQPFVAEGKLDDLSKLWRTDRIQATQLASKFMEQAVQRFDRLTKATEEPGDHK